MVTGDWSLTRGGGGWFRSRGFLLNTGDGVLSICSEEEEGGAASRPREGEEGGAEDEKVVGENEY